MKIQWAHLIAQEVLCHLHLKLRQGVNEGASELCKSKRALTHLGLLKKKAELIRQHC